MLFGSLRAWTYLPPTSPADLSFLWFTKNQDTVCPYLQAQQTWGYPCVVDSCWICLKLLLRCSLYFFIFLYSAAWYDHPSDVYECCLEAQFLVVLIHLLVIISWTVKLGNSALVWYSTATLCSSEMTVSSFFMVLRFSPDCCQVDPLSSSSSCA